MASMHCNIACQMYLQLTVIVCLVIIPILVKVLRAFYNNYKSSSVSFLTVNTSGAGAKKSPACSGPSPGLFSPAGWLSSPPRPAYTSVGRGPITSDLRIGNNTSIPRSRSPIAAYDQIWCWKLSRMYLFVSIVSDSSSLLLLDCTFVRLRSYIVEWMG